MFSGDHRIPFVEPPSRLDRLESTLASLADITLAMHTLHIAKGQYTHEELIKMVGIVSEARPKVGKTFTIEEGLKAIIAAFRIEIQGESKGD